MREKIVTAATLVVEALGGAQVCWTAARAELRTVAAVVSTAVAAAAATLVAVITGRTDRGRPLTWIEVGSVAGATAPIPSAALRAARLAIVGSGQGSVSTGDILAELSTLAREITAGAFSLDTRTVPLAEVERAWAVSGATRERLVVVPRA